MKSIVASGKRKTAIARATLSAGSGKVKINNVDLKVVEPLLSRMRIQEPIILAGDKALKYDVRVNVVGGGSTSQADATRLAIARAFSEKESSLKEVFLNYDRQLLVADVRRKEPGKPNSHGNARAKRQKSYR